MGMNIWAPVVITPYIYSHKTQRRFIQYWITTDSSIHIFLFELQHRPSLDVFGLSIVREILPVTICLGKKLTLSK